MSVRTQSTENGVSIDFRRTNDVRDFDAEYVKSRLTSQLNVQLPSSSNTFFVSASSEEWVTDKAAVKAVDVLCDRFGVESPEALADLTDSILTANIVFHGDQILVVDITYHGSIEVPEDWNSLDLKLISSNTTHVAERNDIREADMVDDGKKVGETEWAKTLCGRGVYGPTQPLDTDDLDFSGHRSVCLSCLRSMWARTDDEPQWTFTISNSGRKD